MLYKFPMPSKHNGVGLYAMPNQQLGIEVGRPRDGTMAYDAELAKGRPVTISRPYGRDDLPVGTGISWSKGKMAQRGSANINDQDPDEDDGDEVVTKLMSYLNDKLTPEQLSSVAAILGDVLDDEEDGDTSGERGDYQAADRRRRRRLARDSAYQRAPTAAENAEFDAMFPGAKLLLRR